MSFVITVYVPTGIVMASDSRQSITVEGKTPDGKPLPRVETVSSDFVYKTFLLERQHVGISSYGEALLGKIPTESHIRRFSEEMLSDDDDVTTISAKLVEFIKKDFPAADTAFHVAGFRKTDRRSIPYVYRCHVGKNTVGRVNVAPNTENVIYGASWGGQADLITSLLRGTTGQPKAPIIWDAMNIQDAIDFAIYAVRVTIDTMRFQARPKNVGGPIDVLAIVPDTQASWIQIKRFRGETPPPR